MAQLKLGILAASTDQFSAWELRLFGKILSDNRFQIAALIPGPLAPLVPVSPIAGWLMNFDKTFLARDHTSSSAGVQHALSLLPHVTENLDALTLDVLLVHGQDDRADTLSSLAKFGAWSLQHAGRRLKIDSLEHVSAVLDDDRSIRICVERTADGGVVRSELSSAVFNIERTPSMTLSRAAQNAVSLIWRDLQRLAATGRLPPDTVAKTASIQNGQSDTAAENSTLKLAGAVAKTVSRTVTKKVLQSAGRRPMMWSLFFGAGAYTPSGLHSTHEVRPAGGEFWADPFLIARNGETFVFFENYVYQTGKGKITAGTYKNGQLHILGDALDLPYHVSFPFVFEHGGSVFMMPETSGAQRLEIWRATDFPLKWELHATALNGLSVADPVLYHDTNANRWWLFVNISDTPFEDHCNELHIFETGGPTLERLTPHALNPVVIGSDTARNAGRIVRRDGRVLRMSQNNTHGVYGYGLNVMEITQLDLDRYEERLISTVSPTFKPGLIGCHHMDQADGLFVADGCRRFG